MLAAARIGRLSVYDPRLRAAHRAFFGSPAGEHPADLTRVATAIDRINIAGLCDPSKRNWYDIDLEDPIREAAKLDATPETVRAMLSQLLAVPTTSSP